MKIENAQIATIDLEIQIDAPVETVWTALAEEIQHWWPEEFYAGGIAGQRKVQMEIEPGGRMYESWDEGGGLLWGHIVNVIPNQTLQLLGELFPAWGGPANWFGTWQLSAHEGGTKLNYSESTLGVVTESGMADKSTGWEFLLASFKAHVEGSEKPTWG